MCYEMCDFIWACDSDSKWVESDKLLEIVLCLMDIHLLDNALQYVYTFILFVLLLMHIWKLWGYSN